MLLLNPLDFYTFRRIGKEAVHALMVIQSPGSWKSWKSCTTISADTICAFCAQIYFVSLDRTNIHEIFLGKWFEVREGKAYIIGHRTATNRFLRAQRYHCPVVMLSF